jgi:Tat protein secretion system quality control protein TatD with DNase activity
MNLRFFDAHNHLQDERFTPHLKEILASLPGAGVERMVVNGSCEEDWPQVLELAQKVPPVIPSFGYHPWYVGERTANWRENLVRFLDAAPSAIGEIGLNKWIKDSDFTAQKEVFVFQLRLAAERNIAGAFGIESDTALRFRPSFFRRSARDGRAACQTWRLLFFAGLLCARTQGAPARNL